jgi:hypothetical protein
MNEITTRTEKIVLEPSGIVICTVNKSAYMELEDGVENIMAIAKLADGKKVPTMVNIEASRGASKACREFFAGNEAAKVQSACALIIKSPLSKLIGNFFIGLNKTKFPTKLFTDKKEAIIWLNNFL